MNKFLYGIDFGTTNSALSIYDEEKKEIISTITVPSLIYFQAEQAAADSLNYVIGEQAVASYLKEGMKGRFIKSIKQILSRTTFTETRIHNKRYTASDLVTLILKDLKAKADQIIGKECHKAIIGRPVFFDDDNTMKDTLAQTRLKKAAESAGFTDVRFQFEPIGAAFAYEKTITKKELVDKIKKDLQSQLPAVSFSSGQPIIDQVMEIVTGSAADLAVSIVGDDLNMMRKKAEAIAKIVKATPGADNVNIEQEGPQEQLAININREAAARFGINVADIQNLIEAAIGGKTISTLYDGTKRYDIVVRFLPKFRNSIDAIRNVQVPSLSGALIPMSQLADIHFIEGQTNIYRYGSKRMVTVRTNIKGRDQGGFVAELQKKLDAQIKVPKGYSVIYGGQYENLERAGKQLLFTIPLTIVMVFLFLFMLFKNLSHTMVTMSCILFALGGGIVALLMRGYYFNVSAGVGFVSIFGISVMAGVLLVSALNRAVEFQENDLRENVLLASTDQLRAVLSILIVAIIGLVPAAISSGIGSDVQRPLATVIIGGLTSTLIFAPILLPPLYLWVEKKQKPKKKEVPELEMS